VPKRGQKEIRVGEPGLLKSKRARSDKEDRCSFCHKSKSVVGKLISSPADFPQAFICDECVAVCNSIMMDDERPEAEPASSDQTQEIQLIRGELRLLLDDIPDSDIRTVAKILLSLVPSG
jgi:hypothetical protein